MPVTRFVLTLCCALLQVSAWAQSVQSLGRGRAKPPAGSCGVRPAECQINAQVFDFGRSQMSPVTPAINGHNTVSVTCMRSRDANNRDVLVRFVLKALPSDPPRQMRDSRLGYLAYNMYVDAARTRYWGDGLGGSLAFEGQISLDDRNQTGTLVFPVYGQVIGGQTALPGQWLGAVVTRLEFETDCR